MGVFRVHAHAHNPAAFPVKLAQPIRVRSQFGRADEREIQRVEEEESVARFGWVEWISQEIGEIDRLDFTIFHGFSSK